MDHPIDFTDSPKWKDVKILEDGLTEHSLEVSRIEAWKHFGFFVRNDADEIIAGLYGNTYGDVMHVSLLWARKDLRGTGLGARLMDQAEAEARRRGCRQIHLDTFSYQAPAFYRKLGFEEFGRIDDIDGEYQRHYVRKILT